MSEHLSASARHIRALESQLVIYQQMAKEYNALLNYLVVNHENSLGTGAFVIDGKQMKKLEFLPIRTEILEDGLTMRITRVTSNGDQPAKSLIILPPSRA